MPDHRPKPSGAVPVERVRGEHPPNGEGWRHDALAGSRHSRLLDELREPLEDHDPDRAEGLCAEIARSALGELAPALLLLPRAERRRARVLAAFTLTLFDFARQRGLDGDRLAEINRWEFALEQALDGQPTGQPVFVLMAVEEERRPWRRRALDRLSAGARKRALGRGTAEVDSRADLAGAFAEALIGQTVPPTTGTFGAALARLLEIRRGAPPDDDDEPACIRSTLQTGPGSLPAPWSRAARFFQLAGRRLVHAPETPAKGPSLGLLTRLMLLLRARFFS